MMEIFILNLCFLFLSKITFLKVILHSHLTGKTYKYQSKFLSALKLVSSQAEQIISGVKQIPLKATFEENTK